MLAESDPLPFPIEGAADLNEEVRLRYRYLDIRRAEMSAALRARSTAAYLVSDVMRDHGFVNVETPFLTRSTPEGARDFLVPVRLRPGSWYALPQSPQLFKQLLMVSGLERYYQLVRCFRDEDFRADRQPEFTQIDIEMSFITREDVIEVAENLVAAAVGGDRRVPGAAADPAADLRRRHGQVRVGQAGPAVRLRARRPDRATSRSREFRVFQAPHVGAVVMPGGAAQTRRELDELAGLGPLARGQGPGLRADRPGRRRCPTPGRWPGTCPTPSGPGSAAATGAGPGDCVFFAAGPARAARELLGAARLEIGRRCGLIDPSAWAFTWVVDAPMFEEDGEGGWTAVHHPFTAPLPEWADKFTAEPAGALADAYDIVCNGTEIGGGSIRIHRPDMQQRVFDVIGLSRDGGQVPVRLPAGRAAVRAAAARRHRVRLGPDADAADRPGLDPRRDRVPQGRVRPRPADRRADADHRPRSARRRAST